MKVVFCLISAIACCAAYSVPSRQYYSEENFRLFQLLMNEVANEETANLLQNQATVRASENDVTYYLYTKTNLENPHIVEAGGALSASPHFDSTKKTFFIIHGWFDNFNADVNTLVRSALLKKHDVNVVVVDWSPIAGKDYATAQGAVTSIGKFVADFINKMIVTHGLSGSKIVLIGHSLGAHIAGNAGSAINCKVEQIIGLDPAGPSFTVENTANRLDPSDAQYVKVIHTNGRFLGFSSSIGHVDFYPNGGQVQAGCGLDLIGACSHARAFQYLADAITGAKYTATLCGSYSDFQNNKCTNNRKSLMGALDIDTTIVGDYYLNTNSAEPFALG